MSLRPFTDEDAARLKKGFLLTVTASSGGGKSIWVQHLLSMKSMRSRFGAWVVVSPTSCLSCLDAADEPNQFACIPRSYHYDLSTHSLPEILGRIKTTQMKLRREGRAQEVLLVLDDIFCSVRGAGQNCTAFAEWVSVKRHYFCSVIAIQQAPKNIAKSIRTQIDGAFFSRPLTYEDRKMVCEWYLCRKSRGTKRATMEHASQILDEAFAGSPYAFLYVEAASKAEEPRDMVRVAIAPSAKPKRFKMRSRRHLRSRRHPSRRRAKKEGDRVNKEPIEDELLLQVHTEAERGSGDDDDDGTSWRLDLC